MILALFYWEPCNTAVVDMMGNDNSVTLRLSSGAFFHPLSAAAIEDRRLRCLRIHVVGGLIACRRWGLA